MPKQHRNRWRRAAWGVALPLALGVWAAQTSIHVIAETPVFGPIDVVRRTAAPEVVRWTFPAASPGATGFLLCVDNGGQRDQYPPVTSANIRLNGAAMFQPRDFKRSVTTLSRPVTLLASNELTAELAGAPGSGIALWIEPGTSCAGVRTNSAPAITSSPVTTAAWLQPYVYPVTATDADHDTLTFSLATAPPGMTIDAATGEVAWTPPAPGTVNAAVRVDDGHGGTTTQSFAVAVAMPSNRPPVMAPIANRRIPFGVPFRLGLAANDPDPADTLTFALQSGPQGASVTPSPVLAWTPGLGQLGFHALTVGVHDAAGASSSTSFTIEVIDSQGAPILDQQPDAETPSASLFTRTISAIDPNPGDTLAFALVGGPSGLTVSPQGALAWTPTASQLGAHQVTVTVNDNAGLSDVGTFTITVGVPAVAQPPVAVDDQYAVRKLTTLTVAAPGVLANDLNPGGQSLTAQLVTPPTKGSLSLSQTGAFSYAPAVPLPGSTMPQLAFQFTLAGLSSTRTQPIVADLDRDGKPEIIFMAMGVFQTRRLVAVHGDTGTVAWVTDAYQPLATPQIVLSGGSAGADSTLAVGDLDGDGYPEILAVHSDNETTNLRRRIIAFNHDGTYRWTSDDALDGAIVTSTVGFYRITLGDLDGDGLPEILVKHTGKGPLTTTTGEDFVTALNSDGHIRWTTRVLGFPSFGDDDVIVADIDLDGTPEVVIAGAVLSNQGQVKWTIRTISTSFIMAYVAVANLDADPFAELVYVDRFGRVFCYEHTGAAKWGPVSRPNSSTFGLPAIGDVDGDGLPEIVLARDNATGVVEVWDRNGNLVRTMDAPGYNTVGFGGSATVFDLNGDGRPEVLYQGAQGSFDTSTSHGSLFIFDGQTGTLLHEMHASRNGGSQESGPIVADVDGDGFAEIVTGGWDSSGLLFVFKAASGHWSQTRPIWNQVAYHVTNVESDGRIPAHPALNWLTPGLNNYRVNVPLPSERTGDIDQFAYTANDGSLTSNVATVRLDVLPPNTAPRILSFPPLAAAGGIEYLYAVRAADPDLGEVLGYAMTQGPAGMTIDANTGLVRWTPPANASGSALAVVRVTDSQGQSDSQQFTVVISAPVIVPSVVGQATASAQSALLGAGLIVGTVAQSSSASILAGQVISQEPQAGSAVAGGAAINLVVSSGPAPVPVPHLIGKTESAALALLSTPGFGVTIGRAFSNTVPDGVVMAQTPAAGTPLVPGSVNVTISAGSGLALRLRRTVTTADAPIPFTAVVYDLTHTESAAPPLNYLVTAAISPSFGALPTVGTSGITPALDTRGAFRVTATDPATGRTTSAEFAVTYPRATGSARTMSDVYAGLSEVLTDIDTLMARGRHVLAANDTGGVYSLLDQMVQRWRQVDVIELRLTTPFGLPQGFFPTPADLPSLGLTPTADDLAAQQVLKDAIEDLEAWTEGLRAPTTSMPELRALADRFNARARRLSTLHMTETGVIKSQALITLILSERLPEFYEALISELAAVVAAGNNQAPDADQFASGPSAAETESTLAEELAVIALDYVVEKIAEAADALNPIKTLREEGFKQAAWTASVVMAANKFKTYAQGQPLTAVVAGSSLSFHAFEQPLSFIEGVFDSDQPANNVVITIGPDVLGRLGLETNVETEGVKDAINTVRNTIVNGDKIFEQLKKVYGWLHDASTTPSELTTFLEDSFQRRPTGENSCLFTTAPDCRQLIYLGGFRSVYETDTGFGLPAPMLFLAYNKTTGVMYVDLPVFIPTKKD